MKPKDLIKVKLDNTKVSVDGRNYDSTHILLIGASKIAGELAGTQIKIDAYFENQPQVEPTMEEATKIYANGSEFVVDVLGERVQKVIESEEGYEIIGDVITIKFESEENSDEVTVKIPRVGSLKTSKLNIDLEGDLSSNIMLSPFVIGEISLKGPTKVKIQVSGDAIKVLKDDTKSGSEEKKLINESTARNQ
ncbi:MAG: hypothetical protein C0201_01380 [Caldisphaera sp.]|nr:MAG: hypothetical protein C0201_01380 [Caldisphaera sp.]